MDGEYRSLYHFLTFLHRLDVPEFARLMSDVESALQAIKESGDDSKMQALARGIVVDADLAEHPDAVPWSCKEIDTAPYHGSASVRERLLAVRAGVA